MIKIETLKTAHHCKIKMAAADRTPDLIHALQTMQHKETAAKNPFKARAYAKVIKQLQALTTPVRTMKDLAGIQGIGESIRLKIQEILDTGKLHQAECYLQQPEHAILEELLKIHAIGPAKAQELVTTHGIRSLAELKAHPELLNDKQRIGLKYAGEFDLRIPRTEMLEHEALLRTAFRNFQRMEIAGSFRRGEPDSGDIDVLVTGLNCELAPVITALSANGYLTDIFAQGPKKCLAVCKLPGHAHHRRIDFMLTSLQEFPFALLYFTGNGAFNVEMRNHALAKGFSLSEHGLKKENAEGDMITTTFQDERDIFRFLGLVYVPPPERRQGKVRPLLRPRKKINIA